MLGKNPELRMEILKEFLSGAWISVKSLCSLLKLQYTHLEREHLKKLENLGVLEQGYEYLGKKPLKAYRLQQNITVFKKIDKAFLGEKDSTKDELFYAQTRYLRIMTDHSWNMFVKKYGLDQALIHLTSNTDEMVDKKELERFNKVGDASLHGPKAFLAINTCQIDSDCEFPHIPSKEIITLLITSPSARKFILLGLDGDGFEEKIVQNISRLSKVGRKIMEWGDEWIVLKKIFVDPTTGNQCFTNLFFLLPCIIARAYLDIEYPSVSIAISNFEQAIQDEFGSVHIYKGQKIMLLVHAQKGLEERLPNGYISKNIEEKRSIIKWNRILSNSR